MQPSSKLAVRTEAAVWLARLRSEVRTQADEIGFQDWLAADHRHRQAFDAATAVFEAAGAVSYSGQEQAPAKDRRVRTRRTVLVGGGVLALTGLGGVGILHWALAPVVETQIGEQRSFALPDGSKVILDTHSLVKVAFTDDHRRIDLVSGRAHFDVAKDPTRPFIVRSGGREVIAIGTAFDVSHENGSTSVVLVEGRVLVRLTAPGAKMPAGPSDGQLMAPGDRLIFTAASVTAHKDRPDLMREIAWQSGRIIFEDDTLQSAATELNRYTRQQLVIADQQAAAMRISGVFRTGDPVTFARSVALLLPVTVAADGNQIVLQSRAQSAGS
jgi:transmembrane sensor